jgi:hypothetical protein
MKAWKVDTKWGDIAEIVFAETANRARSLSANRGVFDGHEYCDLSAHRAPEFDGREANPPTLEELITKHGWQMECSCGAIASASDEPVFRNDQVVRCNSCASRCENCKAVVPEGTWCCEDCFPLYDGDRFTGLPDRGSAGPAGQSPATREPIRAARVEHMKCPTCGEVLPLERDSANMTVLPECPCGARVGLRDLLGQMRDAMAAQGG